MIHLLNYPVFKAHELPGSRFAPRRKRGIGDATAALQPLLLEHLALAPRLLAAERGLLRLLDLLHAQLLRLLHVLGQHPHKVLPAQVEQQAWAKNSYKFLKKGLCHEMNIFLCTGALLYVRYSFLLISNKFCDLSLLLWVGEGGGGLFWAPNGTPLTARCHFTGSKKVSISRAQPPPTCFCNGFARIETITYEAV
jgi:hypothetical protein